MKGEGGCIRVYEYGERCTVTLLLVTVDGMDQGSRVEDELQLVMQESIRN